MKSNAGQVDVGWSFEEFKVGRQVVSPERTMTEADARDFASLTGDDHPLHVDAEYASTTEFGERIAHCMTSARPRRPPRTWSWRSRWPQMLTLATPDTPISRSASA